MNNSNDEGVTGAVVKCGKGGKSSGSTNGEECHSALCLVEHFTAEVTFGWLRLSSVQFLISARVLTLGSCD